jgi:predicted secreted protein
MAGFSSNGNYYLYLESSRDTGAGIPKSTLQVIDLSSSTCVENGCVETRYGESDADLNLAEVEQDLLRRTWRLRQELSLTPPSEGTALPILSRSRTPDGSETVTVRLPNSDQPLQLGLRQQRVAGGTTDKERAAMQLEVIHNGQRRSLDSLDNYRDWVLEYSIREVRQAPDGKSIAILITATKPTFEGTLATTLVQGVELRDGG